MRSGVQLHLMIGPAVPLPVSAEVLDALESVRVTTASGSTSGFQLTFSLGTSSPLHTVFLLSGGSPVPLVRVVIAVSVNGSMDVLMDGVMTDHRVSPGKDPGTAKLTVTGEDLTRVMDYIDFSGIPYPCMPAEARVALILLKYAILGIVPLVIPSVLIDIPLPTEVIPRHQGKDLAYVKALADEVGYTFYLDPGPTPGVSTAYWGPEIRIGEPQPALNGDMDAHANVEAISFGYDPEKKVLPVLFVQNAVTKVPIPIPIPDITPLSPPLGLIPPIPKQIEPISGTAKMSLVRAAAIGLAKAAKTADAVTGNGTLDVTRYGRVLKARRLVGVRGVGTAFDGLYYVTSVTHNIRRGEYKQDFTLARNGLISTLPRVPA